MYELNQHGPFSTFIVSVSIFGIDYSQCLFSCHKDAGDGKGTSKSLLDKIADLESEAQKSFMHR